MKKNLFNQPCTLIAFFCAMFFFSGCSFLRLEKEIHELDQIKVLSGQVTGWFDSASSIIVLIFESGEQGLTLKKSHIVDQGSGHFAVETSLGEYYLAAFQDLNNNLLNFPTCEQYRQASKYVSEIMQ
jgi:hypothetical protein